MAKTDTHGKRSFGDWLQSMPRQLLFVLLIAIVSAMQFVSVKVPSKPMDPAIDLFVALMKIPEGKTVLIESDWTNSTRAESAGEFEALIRILMRKNVKFAIYGLDAQSPQVARDAIARLNKERKAAGQREYVPWEDWVDLKYFPNAEGTGQAFAADFMGAIKARKEVDSQGAERPVTQSPVLKDIKDLRDFPLVVVVTASNTSKIMIQRYYGRAQALGFMVTGVMGPETELFYRSGQLVGLASGLKGVYDLELLMENGLNSPGPDGKVAISSSHAADVIPGFKGETNFAKGMRYYSPLHFAIGLLILGIIAGNAGMFMTRGRRGA